MKIWLGILRIRRFIVFSISLPLWWYWTDRDGSKRTGGVVSTFKPTKYGDVALSSLAFSSPETSLGPRQGVRIDDSRDSFAIRAASGQSLFASFRGARDERAGCRLNELSEGVYSCAVASELKNMVKRVQKWRLYVLLVRRPVDRDQTSTGDLTRRNCVPDLRSLSYEEYVAAMDLDHFDEIKECFEIPYSVVLNTTWVPIARRKPEGSRLAETRANLSVCAPGTANPGIWLPRELLSTEEAAEATSPDLPTTSKDISKKVNTFHHAFLPFRCRRRRFNSTQAKACFDRRRLAFVGDSRVALLNEALALGVFAMQPVPTAPLFRRLGLALLFPKAPLAQIHWLVPHFWTFRPDLEVLEQMNENGTVIVASSSVHDLADLDTTFDDDMMNTTLVRSVLGKEACPDDCEGTIKDCPHCFKKHRAVQTYLANVRRFASELPVRQDGPQHVWITFGRRPPHVDDPKRTELVYYPWQDDAGLYSLMSASAKIMVESAGWIHLDLREMEAGTEGWWRDWLHYASSDGKAADLVHEAIQELLAVICPDPATSMDQGASLETK